LEQTAEAQLGASSNEEEEERRRLQFAQELGVESSFLY